MDNKSSSIPQFLHELSRKVSEKGNDDIYFAVLSPDPQDTASKISDITGGKAVINIYDSSKIIGMVKANKILK